jgi:hypothetical protein
VGICGSMRNTITRNGGEALDGPAKGGGCWGNSVSGKPVRNNIPSSAAGGGRSCRLR